LITPALPSNYQQKSEFQFNTHKRNFYGKAVAARQLENPISVLKRRSFKLKKSRAGQNQTMMKQNGGRVS